jgi:hypothetical protein
MLKKINCKTGLKKGALSKKVFVRETMLCETLSKVNKGKCGWGKCKSCGVIPLLVKLYQGRLVEEVEEITSIKKRYLDC